MLYFQSIVNHCTNHLGSCHYHDTSPVYNWNKSIEAFNQGISEFAFNSYLVKRHLSLNKAGDTVLVIFKSQGHHLHVTNTLVEEIQSLM